jgi:hypothetical protein
MNFHKIKNSHDKHNMRRNETMKTNGLTLRSIMNALRSIMNAINEFFILQLVCHNIMEHRQLETTAVIIVSMLIPLVTADGI